MFELVCFLVTGGPHPHTPGYRSASGLCVGRLICQIAELLECSVLGKLSAFELCMLKLYFDISKGFIVGHTYDNCAFQCGS